MDSNAKSPDICCRICEQNIPLNDFVLHVYYCKEQNNYYKKMNNSKSKFNKYINLLEIYKTKINQKLLNKENNFFKKNIEMNKILRKIKKEQDLFNIDKNNTNNFLHNLIKIYVDENNKPNDFYEKNPDKLSNISTLIYLTYFVYILNKKKLSNQIDIEDNELSEMIGNILSILIHILINTEYLLEARHTKTKSNIYLNNIHYSIQNNNNENSLCTPSGRYHSSKNVVFNEFSINNSQNTSININVEQKNRRLKRRQTFCNMMEDIKNKFSFNKTLLNKSNISQSINPNISIDESSISKNSSTSNIFKKENNQRRNSKAKTLNEINNFFATRSLSENKPEDIFYTFLNNPKKNNNSHNKDKTLGKQHALENKFNSSFKNHKNLTNNNRFHKSSKMLYHKYRDIDKGPIKIGSKKSIISFDRKDSSIDGDKSFLENSIKEFFFQDKKNSINDSLSDSFINSENEKDKNNNSDKNDQVDKNEKNEKNEKNKEDKSDKIEQNDINDNNINHFLTEKTNNILKIKNESKLPSLFLKSDKNFYLKPRDKKSLFRVQHFEKKPSLKDKKNIKHKSNKRNNSFYIEGKDNKVPSENEDTENKDNILNHFEKIKVFNKKRGISPDINKKKRKKKSILEKNKCLVLIDDYESSSQSESDSDSESYNVKDNSNKIDSNFKFSPKNNLILNLKPKCNEIYENSDDSSSSENDNKKDEEKKEIIKNVSFSGDSDSDKQIFEDSEEVENWLIFDTNFFINSDINVQNTNIVNILKELLSDINNKEEDEIDVDKEDHHNDENNDIESPKININFNSNDNKINESNIKFSNFKLVLPLAKGGYGTVGLYKKPTTGDMYAIKSVDINKMKERKLSQTLQNERNILNGISSDYVVNSYYIFKDKTNYYFVMEYLPGGDVYNLLSSIILPFSTIQLIVAETLLAVYYLHSINIIHHDIKPENILITKDGHFKLSDFGLSKTINEEKKGDDDDEENSHKIGSSSCSSSSSLKSENEKDDNKIEGTLYYMAPELFTNEYPIGKSIDYWAIGIVIFELFTYKIPFEGETQEITKQNIIDYNINWEPMNSEEVIKNYKNYIDCAVDLIKKFIFFNPEQRWGDKNFKEIQNHAFFKGFDWVNIKKIKSSAVLAHLKKVVEKNNNKIKELNKKKGEKNNGDLICEVDLAYDESDLKFSQRIDNLQKRNNELIKMKFKKKEIKIEDDDKNFKRSLLFDLQ